MNEQNQMTDISADGVDRRGFLKCMAWAGAGAVWAVKGGVLQSHALGARRRRCRFHLLPTE